MLKRIIFGLLVVCLGASCTTETKTIVNKEEINPFLNQESFIDKSGLEKTEAGIEFWKKELDKTDTPVFKMKLASAYQAKFGITKDVAYLARAEELLQETNEFYKGKNAGVLQTLAQLSITKHDFQGAIAYAEKRAAMSKAKKQPKGKK